MYTFLTVLHVFICLFLILVVLLQAGKGGGMGIGFGSATSQSVFGGSGAGNFMTRMTAIVAFAFIGNSVVLAYLSTQRDSPRLREIAAQKAKAKTEEEASRKKILVDLEKAREVAEKGAAEGTTPTEGAASTEATPEGATAPATETSAPEGAAPAPSTKPAETSGTAPASEPPAAP